MAKKNGTEEVEAQEDSVGQEGWVSLGARLPTWKSDRGKNKQPLVGILMGMKRMPDVDGKEQVGYVFKLTRACKVHEADDKVRIADEGEDVVVFGNAVLNRELPALCSDPRRVAEVSIAAAGTVKSKAGFNVNAYTIKMNPRLLPRPAAYARLAMVQRAPQLPAHQTTDEGQHEGVEIPF